MHTMFLWNFFHQHSHVIITKLYSHLGLACIIYYIQFIENILDLMEAFDYGKLAIKMPQNFDDIDLIARG